MLYASQRRPPRPGGDVPSLTAQPPGLVPSELPRAGCPVAPRPRNMADYRAACAAAVGAPVKEINACDAMPGMRVWHSGHFLTVSNNLRDGNEVELLLVGPGYVASRYTTLETPLYCLA